MLNERQQRIVDIVDENRQMILDAERFIWAHPETGYREWQTEAYLEAIFTSLGYVLTKAGNIPGFFADLDTGRPGPKILIMGEMDALACPTHPQAVNGNAHACGHNAQCAAMAGLAAALKTPGFIDDLSGSIRLMIVPAEELIEIEYRETLRQKGVIRYYGGKVEFMQRGYLDGVDLAFMIHTTCDDAVDFSCNSGGNGCVAKRVIYQGVAAHAGGSPHLGVNALYAAQAGMQAVNALRETFKDEDHIRVHPIMTAGGTSVNIIPAEVRLESYVRGATMESISQANFKVNRALAAGAAALGATVRIVDRPGYAPLNNDENLMAVARTCMEALAGPERVNFKAHWSTGCTDMGDLSCVMPVIHPYATGAAGTGHGDNFAIADPERACVNAAKAQAMMVDELLKDNAATARLIVEKARPPYQSIRDYLAAIDKITNDLDAVVHAADGSVQIEVRC
jgi:amidohydrolase